MGGASTMTTTFNKGFPKYKIKAVANAIEKATAFLKERYPNLSFDGVSINFSNTRHGSYFYHSDASINVCAKDKIFLYKKATCELTSPPDGLNTGCEIQTTCAIIHEITHYIQWLEKRKYSEVETTQNEIDYLKANEPFWYNKLIPIKN